MLIAKAEAYEKIFKFYNAEKTYEDILNNHFSYIIDRNTKIQLLCKAGRIKIKLSKYEEAINLYN